MSFREMRRKDRQVYDDLINEILGKGEYGVISLTGENGYPYGVPVNYAYHNDGIYIHCAKIGHKLDAIKKDSNIFKFTFSTIICFFLLKFLSPTNTKNNNTN